MSTGYDDEKRGGTAEPEGQDLSSNFICDIIEEDNRTGKFGGKVVTRFPPEPNGYLHIGHAKSICLNFGIAERYNSVCHLRFDDTNPVKEDVEYVEAIKSDVAWLGFDWQGKLFFGSDFFEEMYQLAVKLIEAGKAYVDSLDLETMREYRGTLTEPGKNSPHRERSVEENLDLFRRMRAGEFEDGAHVLRAKIDMAAANMLMRDPLLYRIRHATHHRTGDDWCIYPMYDYAHCLEDAFEGVTHSLCTLEFDNNRALYDWVLENTDAPNRPEQTEFARGNLGYTIMSKRNLLSLVQGGHVDGWDDPRMPTIAGFRRRGVTPEAIRNFWRMVGVARVNSVVDMGKLEYCIRDDLNTRVPRVMCVLRPLKVVISNFPEGKVEEVEAQYYPHDVPKEGTRKVPFTREIYIEREDFRETPHKKWYRLAPGQEVRLRYAYIIRCDEVIRDPESDEVVELRCTYDAATRGGDAGDRKVKGTLHWVSADHSLPAEVRIYDRLFNVESPGSDPEVDFMDQLNPNSLEVLRDGRIEPSVLADEPGTRYQFERQGYFCSDSVLSSSDGLIFNRTVGLRDSWAKVEGAKETSTAQPDAAPQPAAKKKKREKPPARQKADERKNARDRDPALAARYGRYLGEWGLNEDNADRLTGDSEIAQFFEDAVGVHPEHRSVAKWVVNEVLREVKDASISELPCSGAALGKLVALADSGAISSTSAKAVFAQIIREGGDPDTIVEEQGLAQMSDDTDLRECIDGVLRDNAEHVARYRAGNPQLLGFFVGAVMKATGGKADARRAKELLVEKLK